MTDLFDIATGAPADIPDEMFDDAYKSGKYGFRSGDPINLKNAETGEVFEVPLDKVNEGLARGFRIERPLEAEERQFKNDPSNQGFSGAAKTFLGKAASGALMDVPETAYRLTADKADTRKLDWLEEMHPYSSITGGLTGWGASILYGGPVWEGIGWAGEKAATKALELTTGAGLGAGSGFMKKAAGRAIDMAAQGTLISAPKALTEEALGDPDAAAQTLIAGGLGGAALGAGESVLGGVIKAGAGAIDPDRLKSMADTLNFKQFGGQTKAMIKKYFGDEKTQASFKKAVDEFGLNKWDTGPGNLDKIDEVIKAGNEALNTTRVKVDKLAPNSFDLNDVEMKMTSLRNAYDTAELKNRGDYDTINTVLKIIEEEKAARQNMGVEPRIPLDYQKIQAGDPLVAQGVLQEGNGEIRAGMRGAENLRQRIAEVTYPAGAPSNQGGQNAYTIFRDAMNNTVDRVAEATGNAELKGAMQEANKSLKLANEVYPAFKDFQMRREGNNATHLSDYVSADIGAHILTGGHGFLGAAGGIAANYVKRNYLNGAMANFVLGAANAIDAIESRMNTGIDAMLGLIPATKELPAKAALASTQIFNQYHGKDQEDESNRLAGAHKFADHLNQFQVNADQSVRAVTQALGAITDHSPEFSGAFTLNMNNAINYLQQNAPKLNTLANPLDPYAHVTSDSELAAFERRTNAVFNPFSILDDIKHGTLTSESLDAVRNVYPKLLMAMQQRVIQRLAQHPVKLPYAQREKIKLFLAQPISTDSVALQALQGNFQSTHEPKPKANSKIKVSDDMQTDISRVINQ